MIESCRQTKLKWLLVLVLTSATPQVLSICIDLRRSVHDGRHMRFLQLRGGGRSESTPSWSAGASRPRRWSSSKNDTPIRYPIVEDVTHGDSRFASSERDANSADTKEIINAFLTRDSRNTFIARVYTILTGQLLVTAISILAFSKNREFAFWMLTKGKMLTYACLGTSMFAWFKMCDSIEARRESPTKWRLLSLFTVGESISVGLISSLYAFRSVLSAMMATAVATTIVTFYTLLQRNPKYDLSQWGAGLASCGIIFMVYGLLHILEIAGVLPTGFMPYSEVIYSAFGACLFSFYLAFHTRLIVSGKHTKYQMNEKDYVYGSMCLYMDVVNIFLNLLRMLGEDSND